MAGLSHERHGGEEMLSAYLDGELRDGELADVVAQLESCPDCITIFRGVKEARCALRTLPVIDVPPGLLPPRHLGDRLSAYLDGEVANDDLGTVGRHLDECAECRHELYEVDAARTAVRALPRLEAVPPVGAVGAGATHSPGRFRRRAAVLIAAGAVAAAAAAIALTGPEPVTPLDLDTLATRHNARVSVESGFSVIPASVASGGAER